MGRWPLLYRCWGLICTGDVGLGHFGVCRHRHLSNGCARVSVRVSVSVNARASLSLGLSVSVAVRMVAA